MNKLITWLTGLSAMECPTFDDCVTELGAYFPLLYQFENTEQDPVWHGEGNVAIHTDMVLQELYKLLLDEAAHITGERRQILILAALLHDIAKPLTTKRSQIHNAERVIAPRHEEIGASYLAPKLMALPIPHSSVLSIMGLVGFHQVPKLLVVKNQDYRDYLRLSLHADMELLYWLEIADMKGRYCLDLKEQLDLLAQFKMFCEEYGLWKMSDTRDLVLTPIKNKGAPTEQTFIECNGLNQLLKGNIYSIEQAVAKNYQASREYSHLYLTCGISGSGKSSWIEQNLQDFEVISLDDIRTELNGKRESQKNRGQVLQLAKKRLKTALANKRDVIWDATNIRKDFRKIICDIGLDYGALITLVVFQLPEKRLFENDKNRIVKVGEDVICKQLNRFEWPTLDEGHRTIIVGDKGKLLFKYGSFH